MEELGSRLKEYRIRKNLQQKELALNAGVGLDTIVRLECGSSISTEKFIRILRVLDMLENYRRIHTGATDQPDPDA